jgi:hypothetical protein
MEGESRIDTEAQRPSDVTAQDWHDHLQDIARQHFAQTGEELSTGSHFMSCWCCCDDEPCASTPMI